MLGLDVAFLGGEDACVGLCLSFVRRARKVVVEMVENNLTVKKAFDLYVLCNPF